MSYRYLEDIATADAAFEARAPTLEDLFRDAADATLAVMAENPEAIEPRVVRVIEEEAEALDLLLFQVLQELVYLKDAERLFLRLSTVTIGSHGGAFRAVAEARGEEIDARRHAALRDVKAVTLHRLRVEKTDQGWEATVVLDI